MQPDLGESFKKAKPDFEAIYDDIEERCFKIIKKSFPNLPDNIINSFVPVLMSSVLVDILKRLEKRMSRVR